MTLNAGSILDTLVSHAMELGVFERVNTHEPKNAPGHGMTVALWCNAIDPIQSSGLDSTSARLTFNLRIYQSMLSEPQDAIDPNVIDATDQLMTAYSGDFDLGGDARHVDLLGAYGKPLSALAGYIAQSDKIYRIMDITIPVVINDVWEQTA